MKRTWIPLLALALASCLTAREYEHPTAGFRIELATGWKERLTRTALLLSAPDGLRVRIETELVSGAVDLRVAHQLFRVDGRRLKSSYGAVKVAQRPARVEEGLGEIGGRPTFRYVLLYRGRRRVVQQAEGYVAGGNSLWPGKQLQVRVLAYGPRKALQDGGEALVELLTSLRWPGTAGEDPPPTPTREPRVEPIPPPPPPPTQVAVAPRKDPEPRSEPVSRPSSSGSGEAIDFRRGSRRGGSALFREAYVSQDREWNDRVTRSFGAKDRDRDERQQAASAARLGFDPE